MSSTRSKPSLQTRQLRRLVRRRRVTCSTGGVLPDVAGSFDVVHVLPGAYRRDGRSDVHDLTWLPASGMISRRRADLRKRVSLDPPIGCIQHCRACSNAQGLWIINLIRRGLL